MKTKTVLMVSMVLNASLLASIAFLTKQARQDSLGKQAFITSPERVILAPAQQTGDVRFGPVYEAILSGARPNGRPELFDLESGQRLFEPDFEMFNRDPRANANWIRATGLDLCAVIGPDMDPSCITYYMSVVPCASNVWNTISASEVAASLELANIKEPKRRSLYSRMDTACYLFRTHEGTCGVLLLPESPEPNHSIRIRYKLVTTPRETLSQPVAVSPQLSRS